MGQLRSLRVSDLILAKVCEVQEGNHLIVSFEGQLLRAENNSGQKFIPGQKIELIVFSLNPISFKVNSKPRAGYSVFV